jgi:hypothetical protein
MHAMKQLRLEQWRVAMYKIEETEYGFKMTLTGFIQKEELKGWSREAAQVLRRQKAGFGALIDTRGMSPLPPDAREFWRRNEVVAKKAGLGRCAHISDDPITMMQFTRIAREVGTIENIRHINASSVPNWEEVALNWIIKGIDPNK